jgi:hypothetical protein
MEIRPTATQVQELSRESRHTPKLIYSFIRGGVIGELAARRIIEAAMRLNIDLGLPAEVRVSIRGYAGRTRVGRIAVGRFEARA